MTDTLLLSTSVGHAVLLTWLALGKNRGLRTRWLAALSADFFIWTLVTYFNHRERSEFATMLDACTNALAIPLTLQFVAVRVGASRAYRLVAMAIGCFFVGLAATAGVGYALGRPDWVASRTWSNSMLFGLVVTTVMVGSALRVAYVQEPAPRERTLLTLTAAAFVVGGVGLGGELLSDLGLPIPNTGPLGVLLATTLLALATIGEDTKSRKFLSAAVAFILIAGVSAVLYAVFRRFGTGVAAGLVVLLAVTAVLAMLARAAFQSAATLRTRRREVALAGRMSAQMIHDLRTPIAALSGALEVLEENSEDPHLQAEMIELAKAQTGRLSFIVENYTRTLRVEPRKVTFSLEQLLTASARSFQSKHPTERIRFKHVQSTHKPLEVDADPDLLSSVIENLVRNAEEALGDGAGEISLSARHASRTGKTFVVLSVADDGPGMEEDVRRSAGIDFFTTKASGSGLGLAFARRVAEAHGGTMSVESRPKRGTRVEVWLPHD